ncbi:MAG: sodium transporter [Candidatus Marinimicrobia bacterium]|nr:sodium transporter [Candidatus Neomarinimicrobiota bacterium]|tara:strand:- start:19109 stop:20707 length:1599 start_codon:yes stop_codon:yes gene_type:complete
MEFLDFLVLGLYFTIILGVGIYSSRSKEDTSEYFLANRNLGWFVIGASLFASNIGSEHLVGLAESGFKKGLIESQFEILAAFMLLTLGWVFVPFYKKSGVTTMPEFLEIRFSPSARMYLSLVSIFAYVITKISVTIFAGAIVFETLLGIDFWTGAIIVVVVTGFYTILGGLKAVIYTDTIQMFLLLGGSILVTIFGLDAAGGWNNVVANSGEGFMSLWRSASDANYPWTAILFGAPILGIWYWCTDQFIVQRVLAAKDESTGRKATIFAGFLKLTPMFIFVLPGMIAYTLHNDPNSAFKLALDAEGNAISSGTLPAMVQFLLPVGLRGLVAAGILSALMSSLSSVFNSCSTLITWDIYRKYNPEESEKKLVRVGQIATGVLVITGMLWIPFQKSLSGGGLFQYIQGIQAYISPPIAAAFLLGLFIKRINSQGVMMAFYTGALLGLGRLISEIMGWANLLTQPHFLHFALYLFLICSGIMLIISYMTPEPDYEKIKNVIYTSSDTKDAEDLKIDKSLTFLLIIFVLIIWYIFS